MIHPVTSDKHASIEKLLDHRTITIVLLSNAPSTDEEVTYKSALKSSGNAKSASLELPSSKVIVILGPAC
jgi:hypothetical protein